MLNLIRFIFAIMISLAPVQFAFADVDINKFELEAIVDHSQIPPDNRPAKKFARAVKKTSQKGFDRKKICKQLSPKNTHFDGEEMVGLEIIPAFNKQDQVTIMICGETNDLFEGSIGLGDAIIINKKGIPISLGELVEVCDKLQQTKNFIITKIIIDPKL